jgi:phosphoglucomutase
MPCRGPVQRTALEVLAANKVETIIQKDDGFTPTPVISRAILVYNRDRKDHLTDGIVGRDHFGLALKAAVSL